MGRHGWCAVGMHSTDIGGLFLYNFNYPVPLDVLIEQLGPT